MKKLGLAEYIIFIYIFWPLWIVPVLLIIEYFRGRLII